jgi:hypothetical protein
LYTRVVYPTAHNLYLLSPTRPIQNTGALKSRDIEGRVVSSQHAYVGDEDEEEDDRGAGADECEEAEEEGDEEACDEEEGAEEEGE